MKKKGLSIYREGQHCSHAYSTESRYYTYIWLRIVNIARLNFSTTARKKKENKSPTRITLIFLLILGRRYTRWLVGCLFI